MSEENTVPESQATSAENNGKSSFRQFENKVDSIQAIIGGWFKKATGLVSDWPWKEWLEVANKFIARYLPFVIVLSVVLGVVFGLIVALVNNLPIGTVFKILLGGIAVGAFSMHLAPKAMEIPRSMVEKNEPEAVRPELMEVAKTGLGLGLFAYGIVCVFSFNSEEFVFGIVCMLIAALLAVVLGNPEAFGIKAGYPTNLTEELITIVLIPIKVVMALFSPITAIATLCVLFYGLIELITNFKMGGAPVYFLFAAAIPLFLPLAFYGLYLLYMFFVDIVRAIIAVPRKIDELKK